MARRHRGRPGRQPLVRRSRGPTGDGKIGRITTAGDITEFSLPNDASRPYGIAAGPDGNLWFTEGYYQQYLAERSASRIGRITTAGVITEYPLPNP